MAECEEQQVQEVEEDELESARVAYKPPAEKSIDQILKTDEEDESLRKYKEQLLGQAAKEKLEFWPNEPNVILRKMSILVEGRPNEEIDLQDKGQLKNMKFKVKEGVKYKLMISFNVQREIVSGLKLFNKISRGPKTTKEQHMVGSYAPREEIYEFKSPEDEFPSGMLLRGDYKVKSQFTDDDKNEILSWEWKFEINKDWK